MLLRSTSTISEGSTQPEIFFVSALSRLGSSYGFYPVQFLSAATRQHRLPRSSPDGRFQTAVIKVHVQQQRATSCFGNDLSRLRSAPATICSGRDGAYDLVNGSPRVAERYAARCVTTCDNPRQPRARLSSLLRLGCYVWRAAAVVLSTRNADLSGSTSQRGSMQRVTVRVSADVCTASLLPI